MSNRRGWTMIELLIVIVILGLLSSLAVHKYIDLSRAAFAAKIVGEFTTVRLAAYNYEADHSNSWPGDQGPGIAPPELDTYLPDGFSFVTPTYQLDWDNRAPSVDPFQIAISVTTTDAQAALGAFLLGIGLSTPQLPCGTCLRRPRPQVLAPVHP